ncbi:uncharacterized protein LOC143028418 isoform X2 [Oratosquilla oratoria]|uniref:uncharacterized protein LOC143028418 isoform X2 n=1 Tax=Oratosquilla oratoria TaxID=337810 RepID=UPI003F7612AE
MACADLSEIVCAPTVTCAHQNTTESVTNAWLHNGATRSTLEGEVSEDAEAQTVHAPHAHIYTRNHTWHSSAHLEAAYAHEKPAEDDNDESLVHFDGEIEADLHEFTTFASYPTT